MLSTILCLAPLLCGAPEPAAEPPVLRITRLQGTTIRVDGRLDEPVWSQVAIASDFRQRAPNAGEAATQRTEARIAFDEAAVYVAVRLYDTRPDSIAGPLARRDASGLHSDWIAVQFDSRHDRRTGFSFAVNPRGVRRDLMLYDDTREDPRWDAVWEAAAATDSLGWTAEFRIPLSQLRFDPGQTVWGLNFQRRLARRNEVSLWAPTPPDVSGYVSRFGELKALRPHRGRVDGWSAERGHPLGMGPLPRSGRQRGSRTR